jgi:two-component system, cell cycle response regulator
VKSKRRSDAGASDDFGETRTRNGFREAARVLVCLVILAATPAWPQQKPADLTNQSLEDLMNIEVNSASKKEEKLSRTASAIFVITQDDNFSAPQACLEEDTMTTDEKPSIRILVAEDDPVSRRVLEVFLLKRGFEVVTASNGTEALEILEKEDTPRLALLDWMMPGLEGIQVCQRVRERNSQAYVYILLLTARSQKEDLLRGLDSGADDYVTKPFDPRELHARLRVGMRILDLQDNLIAAREELRFRASHDALTGVANRGAILETLRREHSRQMRAGGSFGIIMVDLDHFKKVNDTYGHPCGDAVLQEAARRMTSSVRDYDVVGRYGGEEFLIVVPGADASATLGLAERIRKAFESKPVSTQEGDINITASLGVAANMDARRFDSDTVLRLADEALYRAKARGRNCSEPAKTHDSDSTESTSAEPSNVKLASR